MSRRRRLAARLAAGVVLSLLFLAPARARAATVLIVRPAAPSPAAAETLSRLHGELLAVGLAVDVAVGPDHADTRAWMRRAAQERALDAALEILDGGPLPAVDVWIFPGGSGEDQVSSVVAVPGAENAVEQLAIRAVDFVRSILIERHLGAPRAREPAPPPALSRREEPTRPSSSRPRLGVALGAAFLTSPDGGAAALAPLARVEATLGATLALQLEGAGLGTRPAFASKDGSATLARQYLLAGVCTCAPSPRRLRPIFAVGAGALHTSAEGRAAPSASAHDVARWSLLLQATLGARLTFLEDYELSLAAHAQLAQPYVTVYVGDAAVATVGRPTFALTLTLGGWR